MTRKLFLLNGLAILAVVLNHAAFFGLSAMFWWTYRYLPGSPIPNYDQAGTLPYHILSIIIKLSTFIAIPSFLFVSGFFIAYTSRGQHSQLSWKVIKIRITTLLIPYIIWSLAVFFGDWLQSCLNSCTLETPGTYMAKLAFGGATYAYWYVIVLCQLYLLSPFFVSLAKTRWRLLLFIAILIQLGAVIMMYLIPSLAASQFFLRLFPRHIIYFVVGIIAGLYLSEFKQWLAHVKWVSITAVIVFGILSLYESEIIYYLTGGRAGNWGSIMPEYAILTAILFAISFIFSFLAFDITIPYARIVYQLGSRSYGIFLTHWIVLEVVSRIVFLFVPWVLAYQILYQPILIISAITIPYLFMSFVAKSRFKRSYRYLFG